jgi:hypothetical protein
MTARKIALALLLAAAAACTEKGDVEPGGAPALGPETAAAYCDQLWTTFAARWAACDRGSLAFYAAIFDPQLRCADALAAIAGGRATYDRASAGGCLDFVATASCDALEAHEDGRSPAPACLAAVAGTLAPGATCYSNESCASDVCLGTDFQCPASCAARVGPGAACTYFAAPCVPGYQCERVDTATFLTCRPLKAQGARCLGDDDCAPGLHCDSESSEPFSPMVCLPGQTSGACTNDYGLPPRAPECAIAYACVGGQCVLPAGPGESCADDSQCGNGLSCSSGRCVDGPVSGSCGGISRQLPCIGGACNTSAGFVCVTWGEGSWCNFSWDCAPGMACNDTHQCYTPCAEP